MKKSLSNFKYGQSACCLLILLPTLLWIACNRSVWPFDPAWYGEVSISLWLSLLESPGSWFPLMLQAFGSKAPLIAWIGQFFVPLGVATNNIEAGLLLLICSASFCSLSLVWSGAHLLFKELSYSIAAICIFASAPLFLGLSRQYFVESMQLACVCWSLHAVFLKQSKLQLILSLVIISMLGLLTKISSPLYMFCPMLLGAYIMCIPTSESSQKKTFLLSIKSIIALLLIYLTYAWYSHNLPTIKDFIASTSSGPVALLYGSAGSFIDKFIYWSRAYLGAFFINPSFGLVWLSLLVISFPIRWYRGGPWNRGDLAAILSVVQILCTLSVFARQINEETRYLLPLLPYHALLSLFMLKQWGSIIRIVYTLGLTSAWIIIEGISFGVIQYTLQTPWLPVIVRDTYQQDILTSVVSNTCPLKDAGRYIIIGVEYPWFNANSAAFYMQKLRLYQKHQCPFTSLGYAESDINQALARIDSLQARAIVFPTETINNQADPFNMVSKPTRDALGAKEDVQKHFLGQPPIAEIFERLTPLR